MKKIISVIMALLITCTYVHDARSETGEDECTGLQDTSRIVQVEGEDWVAMPPFQAACMDKRIQQRWKLDLVLDAKNDEIAALKRQVRTATRAVDATQDLAIKQEKRGDEYKDLSDRQAAKLEELDSWYRSPLFWTGVGAVGVIAICLVFHCGSNSSGGTTIIER